MGMNRIIHPSIKKKRILSRFIIPDFGLQEKSRNKTFWGKLFLFLVLVLGFLFLPVGFWAQSSDQAPLPHELLNSRLYNPGLALSTSLDLAQSLRQYLDATDYFPSVLRAWNLLELSQNYGPALSLLEQLRIWYIDLPAESTQRKNFDSLVQGNYRGLTPGRLFLRIPEYQIHLGDYHSARTWLSQQIPLLQDSGEIHFAALLLARVLYFEGRIDQSRVLLTQRFIQPLMDGVLPPYGGPALLLFARISRDLTLQTNEQRAWDLMERKYSGTLYYGMLSSFRGETPVSGVAVQPFPSPGELLFGSYDFHLGVTPFVPLENPDEPDSQASEGPALSLIGTPSEGSLLRTEDPISPREGRNFVQIGSFTQEANAMRMKEFAESRGFEVLLQSQEGGIRILVPIKDRDPTILQLELREAGIEGFFVGQ